MASRKKKSDAPQTAEAVDATDDQRQDRLKALKARRQSLGSTMPEMNFGTHPTDETAQPPQAPDDATAAAAAGPLKTEKMKAFRAKVLPKIYLVLTQTRPDHRGMLANTEYSMAGFDRFIALLEGQAANSADERIAKFCGMMLKFLAAAKGEEATANGISIAKLVMLAEKGEALKGPNAGRVKPAAMRPAPGHGLFGAAGGRGVQAGFGGSGPRGSLMAQPTQNPRTAILRSNPVIARDTFARMMHLLKNTPEDEEGMAPGTEFSKAGIGRMMTMLDQRSAGPQTAASDMAQAIAKLIVADSGDAEAVHGADIIRLKELIEKFSQFS